MQCDDLEKFVLENKSSFDDQVPDPALWEGIAQQLSTPASKKLDWWKWTRMAAAVMLLMVSGGLIHKFFIQQDVQMYSPYAGELAEMEDYYTGKIQEKYAQVVAHQQSEDADMLMDVEQMDEFISELKTELEKAPNGSEEVIIQNMIKTYQMKLEVLDRILDRLQQNSIEQKDNGDESISI